MSTGTGMQRDLTSQEVAELLFSYTPKIAGEKDLDHLLILMANLGRKLVVADRCSLWLLDETKEELWTRVAHGVPEIRMPASKGFAGDAVRTGEVILINDAYNDPRHNAEIDRKTGYRTKAMIVIPIRTANGKTFGAFQAIN
ncbi:MAG TPA: GAF domain-containing protein, partial [Fibrobacteraceae bacterium]|nr:GAF domain-containing protein [Fibrobacteraceae bacterium]